QTGDEYIARQHQDCVARETEHERDAEPDARVVVRSVDRDRAREKPERRPRLAEVFENAPAACDREPITDCERDRDRNRGTRSGVHEPSPRRSTYPAVPKSRDRDRSTLVDHTYKITEIVGSSSTGIDDAIRSGIDRASQTLRNLDWFEVTEI